MSSRLVDVVAYAGAVLCGLGAIVAAALGEWTVSAYLLVAAAGLLVVARGLADAVARIRLSAVAGEGSHASRPGLGRWWSNGRAVLSRRLTLRRLRAELVRVQLALGEAAYRGDREMVETARGRLRAIDDQIRQGWVRQLEEPRTEPLPTHPGAAEPPGAL